jgi:hypothetical protein
MSRRTLFALVLAAALVVLPSRADARKPRKPLTGGTAYGAQATKPAPVPAATVGADGLAVAPAGAPPAVVAIIAAGNAIATLPYRYGGGHGDWLDTAYDCSGSVSFALHGAALLDTTLDSTGLSRWGLTGAGRWVTVYANADHAYMVVAGLRFDTSGRTKAGSRWQAAPRSGRGYHARHPLGL